jgi:hypothetical protein
MKKYTNTTAAFVAPQSAGNLCAPCVNLVCFVVRKYKTATASPQGRAVTPHHAPSCPIYTIVRCNIYSAIG